MSHEKDVVEGEPVELGDLHYNVDLLPLPEPERHRGLRLPRRPAAAAEPETTYFGVFFEVQNETEEAQPLPDKFTIEDADHENFESLRAKASTPSRSAAKSKRKNRSRCSTRPPSRARSRARWSSSCCPTTPPRTAR